MGTRHPQRTRVRLAAIGGAAGALVGAACVQGTLLAMHVVQRRTECHRDDLWPCLEQWLTVGAVALAAGTVVLGVALRLAGVAQPWTASVLVAGTMWPVTAAGLVPRPDFVDPRLSLPLVVGVASAAYAAAFAHPRSSRRITDRP